MAVLILNVILNHRLFGCCDLDVTAFLERKSLDLLQSLSLVIIVVHEGWHMLSDLHGTVELSREQRCWLRLERGLSVKCTIKDDFDLLFGISCLQIVLLTLQLLPVPLLVLEKSLLELH